MKKYNEATINSGTRFYMQDIFCDILSNNFVKVVDSALDSEISMAWTINFLDALNLGILLKESHLREPDSFIYELISDEELDSFDLHAAKNSI